MTNQPELLASQEGRSTSEPELSHAHGLRAGKTRFSAPAVSLSVHPLAGTTGRCAGHRAGNSQPLISAGLLQSSACSFTPLLHTGSGGQTKFAPLQNTEYLVMFSLVTSAQLTLVGSSALLRAISVH